MHITPPLFTAALAALITVPSLVSGCAPGDPLSAAPFPSADVTRFEAALDATFAAQGAPGATMIVHRRGDDERVWTGQRGAMSLSPGAPAVTEHTLFRTASSAKTFIGALILALHDEGRLSVNDPISEFTDIVPGGESITLRMLMQHTSGVANYTQSTTYRDAMVADPDHLFTYEELVSLSVAEGPDFPPDTGWNYSNTGYILLTMVAESLVHRPLEEELEARFFGPLGMHDTAPLANAPPPAMWTGYLVRDGEVTESHAGGAYVGDGGAWVTSLHDLTVWAEAFFGGRLHRPETMVLAQGTGGGELLNGVAQAFGLTTGGYGHGLVVASDDTLGVLLAGAGNGGGARTFVGYLPEHDLSFVVAVSAGDGSVPIVETLSATRSILEALRVVLAAP
jgi:D-alanyl-D-alanine carboxypeptidase